MTIEAARSALRTRELEVEHLKLVLAKLRRMQYGRRSEQLDERIGQLELSIEELEATLVQEAPASEAAHEPKSQPVRRALPTTLPRELVTHAAVEPGCACPECGGALRVLGEDVTEILERVPEHFKVMRHVRP